MKRKVFLLGFLLMLAFSIGCSKKNETLTTIIDKIDYVGINSVDANIQNLWIDTQNNRAYINNGDYAYRDGETGLFVTDTGHIIRGTKDPIYQKMTAKHYFKLLKKMNLTTNEIKENNFKINIKDNKKIQNLDNDLRNLTETYVDWVTFKQITVAFDQDYRPKKLVIKINKMNFDCVYSFSYKLDQKEFDKNFKKNQKRSKKST